MIKRILSSAIVLAVTIVMGTSAHAFAVDLSNPGNYTNQSYSTAAHSTATSSTLALSGNVWATIALDSPFTVAINSVLTFSYSSTELPEIAGIVFDTNTSFYHNPDEAHAVCIGGTDGWADAGYVHPTPYQVGDGLVTYSINLASFLTVGDTYNYLVFINDDDLGGALSNGYFANVSLSATPIPGAIWLLGSGLVGLMGIRRRKQA